MKKILTFFCLLLASLSLSLAQTPETVTEKNPYYEISNIFHERAGQLVCDFLDTEIRRIEDMPEKKLSSEFWEEEQSFNEPERKNFKSHIKKNLEKICHALKGELTPVLHRTLLGNSVLLNSATFPVTGLFHFWSGFFSRRKDQLSRRQDFLLRVLGPKTNANGVFLNLLTSELMRTFLRQGGGVRGANASVVLEMWVNYRCFYLNPYNEDLVKLCKNYSSLKDFFHRGHERIFKLGKKVQYQLDQRIIRRREDRETESFCELSEKRQVQEAKRVLQRYPQLREDPRVKKVNLLPPIHKNTCTKILFYLNSPADLAHFESKWKTLEGVQVVFLPDNTFPEQYLFTQEELKRMNTEDAYCHEVESTFYGELLQNEFQIYSDLFKSAYAPSLLSRPKFEEIVVPDDLLRRAETSSLDESYKNVIFAVSPEKKEEERVTELQKEREILLSEIKTDYDKTMRARSFEGCKRVFRERRIDPERFTEKIKKIISIDQNPSLKKKEEFKLIQKVFLKAKKKLKLNWELVRTNDLKEVMNALNSRKVRHVIIIAHGRNSGHLIDHLGQEYPQETFSFVSPSLESLNFYSCYSGKLIELYDLKNKLSQTPSFHKIRVMTSVTENEFMDAFQLAPIGAFGVYLHHMDHYLFRSEKGGDLFQEKFGENLKPLEEEALCELDPREVKIIKGSYALTLNDRLIGVINATDNRPLSYPCLLVRPNQTNVMKLKSILVSESSLLENPKEVTVSLNHQTLRPQLAFHNLVIFKF